MLKYVVYFCKGCDGYCVFCVYCDALSCRFMCMGCMSVSSCKCCMVVSCVHPVVFINAAFCMTCSLLSLGVVAILLLNVIEVFSVGGGALLDRPCLVFQGMCVLCL